MHFFTLLSLLKYVVDTLQANMTTLMATGPLASQKGATLAARMSTSIRNNVINMRGRSIPARRRCPTSAVPQPVYLVSPSCLHVSENSQNLAMFIVLHIACEVCILRVLT